MVSQLAIASITGYQRWISPRKGFNCAHRVLHGGTGCSGYTKAAIREHGLWGARPYISARFAECKMAAQTLTMARQERPDPKSRKGKGKWYDYCDCSGCGGFGGTKSGGCDATPDCTPDCSCG